MICAAISSGFANGGLLDMLINKESNWHDVALPGMSSSFNEGMSSFLSSFSTSTSEVSSSEWSSIPSSFKGVQNNEENLVPGIIGWYKIDLSIAPKNRDPAWDRVEITWKADTNSFTWSNQAGVSWTLKPISGKGGWDTTQLTVGNDNPYFTDGYTTAKIEWVSFNLCPTKPHRE